MPCQPDQAARRSAVRVLVLVVDRDFLMLLGDIGLVGLAGHLEVKRFSLGIEGRPGVYTSPEDP